MTKTEARRLKYLADKMAKLPKSAEKHFDMTSYFRHKGAHRHEFGEKIGRKDLNSCGTVACAFGWAATMPYFQKLGVRVSVETGISVFPDRIFGPEASDLFYDYSIKTPKQWATAARKFLRDNA